jgi:hypothetical protein
MVQVLRTQNFIIILIVLCLRVTYFLPNPLTTSIHTRSPVQFHKQPVEEAWRQTSSATQILQYHTSSPVLVDNKKWRIKYRRHILIWILKLLHKGATVRFLIMCKNTICTEIFKFIQNMANDHWNFNKNHTLPPGPPKGSNILRSSFRNSKIRLHFRRTKSRGSAVGIVIGCGVDDRGVGIWVPIGSRIFTSKYRPHRLWVPPNLLSNG